MRIGAGFLALALVAAAPAAAVNFNFGGSFSASNLATVGAGNTFFGSVDTDTVNQGTPGNGQFNLARFYLTIDAPQFIVVESVPLPANFEAGEVRVIDNEAGSGDDVFTFTGNLAGFSEATSLIDPVDGAFLVLELRRFDGALFGSPVDIPTTVTLADFDTGTLSLVNASGTQLLGNLQFFEQNNIAGVPEPAAWALMIAGFGLVGSMVRRRRAIGA